MSDKQNLPEVDSSSDHPDYLGASKTFLRQEYSRAAGTEFHSVIVVNDMTSMLENPPFLQSQFPFMTHAKDSHLSEVVANKNKAFMSTQNSACPDFDKTTGSPPNASSEVTEPEVVSPKLFKDMSSKFENPHFLQSQSPSMTSVIRGPTSKSAMNALVNSNMDPPLQMISNKENFEDGQSSSAQNTDMKLRKEFLTRDQVEELRNPMEFLSIRLSENLQNAEKVLPSGQEVNLRENELSSGRENYNTRPTVIAFQLSASNETINPQVQNPDFKDCKDGRISSSGREDYIENKLSSSGEKGKYFPSRTLLPAANQLSAVGEANDTRIGLPNENSTKYFKLYMETLPENYDFAMNIMAYVEFLNDSSWKTTISCFDEYVKSMLKYLWTELKSFFDSKIELQTIDCNTFLGLMDEYAQSSKRRKYDLGKFLNYCTIMAHLGVTARKRNFNNVPMYAIILLRDAIRETENFRPMGIFEIHVKRYAESLVKDLKL